MGVFCEQSPVAKSLTPGRLPISLVNVAILRKFFALYNIFSSNTMQLFLHLMGKRLLTIVSNAFDKDTQ